MVSFDIGETIICSITVKDSAGALQDPATSMNIVINRVPPNYVANIVSSTAMTKDSTGTYHYDFASAGKDNGKYEAVYTATDGTRITIEKDTFELK
uniref:Uncharacterized protein n=1 Tax=viral metagenome TaxID=1070528 RepID=A0A6M3J8Y1_9ZZZZ